jgi:hypothetical protein
MQVPVIAVSSFGAACPAITRRYVGDSDFLQKVVDCCESEVQRRIASQLIRRPIEDDSSQFQSTGDVIQHGKRGGLPCRFQWRFEAITMPLA